MTLCFLLPLLLAAAHGTPPLVPSSIWPQPLQQTLGTTTLPICAAFTLSCPAPCPAPLPAAVQRYDSLIFFGGRPSSGSASPALCALVLTAQAEAPLSPAVNESYTLTVPADGSAATLVGATQWGVLRGLESFLQLVVWQGPDSPAAYTITAAPLVVQDAPRFTHRGVLIDTSFNFLTVERIQEVLDSMPVLKANILHWHMLDDPAWPMASTAYPAFTAPGSGGPYAAVATYSTQQQAALAAYAWERGVMVLLEYDVPGHCASWGAGDPNLVTACPGHQTLINPVGEVGTGFYAVLEGLMREFHSRIGSPGLPLVHLGGDEVTDYSCWLTNPQVQAWGVSLGLNSSDATALRTAFTQRVQAVAARVGLRAAFWEESFLGNYGVNASAVVTPWVHADTAGKAAAAGHDIINYIGGYMDQWRSPARTDTNWYSANVSYGYIESWRLYYTYDDTAGVPPDAPGRVLGGVASAWGDNVDSSLGAAGLLFPRGLAVGERLWSPAAATYMPGGEQDPALDAVAARLEWARCRLVQRGVGASPVGIAGTYGFCWSPKWEAGGGGGSGGGAASPSSGLSGGSLAASLLGAAAAGALGAALCMRWASGSASASATESGSFAARGSEGAEKPLLATAQPPLPPSPASTGSRMLALDQFRGVTMVAMLFVNLYYGRSGLAPIFSHGITYMSGPDLVEPAFHFCVGFALRLVVLKRLSGAAPGAGADADSFTGGAPFWAPRLALFRQLFFSRVLGLIVLSMFFSEGWGQFDTWAEVTSGGLGGFLLALLQNVQPYHTLLHIALLTVWTFVPMTLAPAWRVAQLAGTALLHALLLSTFYFQWIKTYGLDEGGYFGFLGWSLTALTGSLAHDVVVWARDSSPSKGVSSSSSNSSSGSQYAPLLPMAINSDDAADAPAQQQQQQEPSKEDTAGGRKSRALAPLALAALALMLLAYLLSCLGAVPALNPVCFNGQRIFFWGGFGDVADCARVPTYLGGWAVAPPFVLPNPATNVVTQWTMTQRAGSLTYHLFTAGTSLLLFTLFLAVGEVGLPLPTLPAALGGLWSALGLSFSPSSPGRWLLRWSAADLYGENSLAVYLFSDPLANSIGAMLPQDCPAWYFLLWGEGLYFLLAYCTTAYLRHHKLFLRL